MRDVYDFSQGEHGKFYHADIKLNIPIYLDEEVSIFVDKIESKKAPINSPVANQLLKGDMKIAEAME